jgi:RNA polymerase sigma-70 factor (ECF subfamily)
MREFFAHVLNVKKNASALFREKIRMVTFPKDLVVSAQNGNEKAKEDLLQRASVLSRNILLTYKCDTQDLEDLLDECIVRILKSLKTLKTPHQFRYFVVVIARHVMIDHIRKKNKKSRIVLLPPYQLDFIPAEKCDAIGIEELHLCIISFLREMPLQLRKTFLLTEIHGLSYKKTADILHISPSTVHNFHLQVMNKFRNELFRK